MTVSDIFQFTAHWTLIGVLMFFFIGTAGYLMGLFAPPRWWKIAALLTLGFLVVVTLLGALL